MKKNSALFSLLAVLGGSLSAQTLFFESFDNTVDQQAITVLQDWNWAVSDGGVSNTTNRQFGRLSAAAGCGWRSRVRLCLSKRGVRLSPALFGMTVPTFSQNAVTGLSAFVGNSNATNQVRFLIQIDNNDWFVSTAAGQTNVGVAGNFSAGAAEFTIPFFKCRGQLGCVGF